MLACPEHTSGALHGAYSEPLSMYDIILCADTKQRLTTSSSSSTSSTGSAGWWPFAISAICMSLRRCAS